MKPRRCGALASMTSGLILLAATHAQSAMDVNDVLVRARQAIEPGKDMRANVDLTIANAKGEEVHWTGVYYRKGSGGSSVMRMLFESPLDLRGTDVSVHRSADGVAHTRIYLPTIRRMREIQGDERGESFLGTDFNYEDLGLQQVQYRQHTLSDDPGGYRVESVPTDGWWYGRIVRTIDKKTFLPIRTEYYDRSGVLWKVRVLDQVRSVHGYVTPTRISMQTVPTGTSTVITFSNVEYDTSLPDSLLQGP